MCAITGFFELVGSYFGAGAGADAATTAAAADAAATTGATAAGTSAAAAGTGAAATGATAATATTAASATAASTGSIATTASEAAAIASGASAVYTLSQGSGKINVPPVPITQPAQVDQAVANAEQSERARRAAAGGLQSTIGTGPGQAGAILNPATLSNRSMLGA